MAVGFKGKKRDKDAVILAEFASELQAFLPFIERECAWIPTITANAGAKTAPVGDDPMTCPRRAGLRGAAHGHASWHVPDQDQGDKRSGVIQSGFDFNRSQHTWT